MTQKKSKPNIETPSDEEIRKFGGSVSSSGKEDEDSQQESEATEDVVSSEETADSGPLQKQLEEAQDKLLRAKAETQNVIRRAATEKSNAIRFANEGFVRALLPVLDDFERTLQAAEESGEDSSLADGVRLVYEKLTKVFSDNNVTVIEAEGKPFNPEVHQAVMRQPSPDTEPNMVLHVLHKGYMLYDRVVRPTQVVISEAAPEKSAEKPIEDGTTEPEDA